MTSLNATQFGCQAYNNASSVQFGATDKKGADKASESTEKACGCAPAGGNCDTDTVKLSTQPTIEVDELEVSEGSNAGNKLLNTLKNAGAKVLNIILAPFKGVVKAVKALIDKVKNRGELQDATDLSDDKLNAVLKKASAKDETFASKLASAIEEATEDDGNIQTESLRAYIEKYGQAKLGVFDLANAVEMAIAKALVEADA